MWELLEVDEMEDRGVGELVLILELVRTGVLVIHGESKINFGLFRSAEFTHFEAWLSARFLDARASWISRLSTRFSSSKAAISRFSLLYTV